MSLTIHRVPEVCDFCSDEHVVAAFPCPDFVLPEYGYGSKGAFAACRQCADLISAGKKDELATRAIATFRERFGKTLPLSMLKGFVLRLHAEFWKHQGGKAA